MTFSLPYILLVLFYGILSFFYESETEEKRKREFIVISISVFLLFFGFRGYIGDDWTNYYPYFQKCSTSNLTLDIFTMTKEWNYEPGFTLLNLICKSIIDDFRFFTFVCCCIDTILIYWFLKKYTDNFPLGLLLYICMGGFVMSTNLMRNSISILIFINALKYLLNRQPLPYFLFCTLAFSFHLSALIYFPLYFFFHWKTNKWIYLAIFIGGNIIFLAHIKFATMLLTPILGMVDEKLLFLLEGYTEGYDASKTLSIGYLERLLTGVLIFCYYDKLINLRKENKLFINAFIVYFFFFFYLSEFEEMSLRLSTLFTFFYWVIWADLLKCFSIDNNRRLYIAYISLYCVMKITGQTNLPTLEYDNVLFGAKSYNERIYIHEHYSNPNAK